MQLSTCLGLGTTHKGPSTRSGYKAPRLLGAKEDISISCALVVLSRRNKQKEWTSLRSSLVRCVRDQAESAWWKIAETIWDASGSNHHRQMKFDTTCSSNQCIHVHLLVWITSQGKGSTLKFLMVFVQIIDTGSKSLLSNLSDHTCM
jgi:hypothetical protein